ncbi:MAG TPA: DNA translocase FtsK 4TM domain-containing protein, partial [Candidatus Omnitrophota bacterium]|nr:DNA translocase FtsK 4TM domain-containing protein [Candidatus Omnitrophota bacterium]
MRERRINEVKGIVLVAVGLMVLASLIRFDRLDLVFYTSHPNFPPKNLLGVFGAYMGGCLILFFGNICSFIIPLLAIRAGIKYFRQDKIYISLARIIGVFTVLISLSSLIGMFNLDNDLLRFQSAGFFGSQLSANVTRTFAVFGASVIFTLFLIIGWAFFNEELISSLFFKLIGKIKSVFAGLAVINKKQKDAVVKVKSSLNNKNNALLKKPEPENAPVKPKIFMPEAQAAPKPKIQINKVKPQTEEIKPKPGDLKIGDYHLPSVELLDMPSPSDSKQMKEDLEDCARTLENTLEDFGISAKVTDIIRGPVITRYELEPAAGVKINRIENLSDDIALAIKAQSIRII